VRNFIARSQAKKSLDKPQNKESSFFPLPLRFKNKNKQVTRYLQFDHYYITS